ncbi:MAG: hypothetical protein HRU70_03695 [Phycisphaeraceae bacterium]|nr:MAG: hypothetical protein HRU70_03695 [Phycisphaeraceae bacterium]
MDVSSLQLSSAKVVRDLFEAGAAACASAACRKGSIEVIGPPGVLIATGDLHDNPAHLGRLLEASGLSDGLWAGAGGAAERALISPDRHLLLHEIIHPPRLINGMDFSFRALARVAALKAQFPERVHVMLGNHELAQALGTAIIKDGVKVVDAFNAGLEYAYGIDADHVADAIKKFVLSMPIALRCVCPGADGRAGGHHILCSHSLPSPAHMARFDPTLLARPLEFRDFEPLRGSAYMMVWGRGHDAEILEDLVERWGVNLFILGHEYAERGIRLIPPCGVVLNSDHAAGVYVPLDLSAPPRFEAIPGLAVPLGG